MHTTFLGPVRETLPDGSVAEYPPGTRITFDFSGESRRVSFAQGRAHFDVRPEANRPFIVTAGGVAVRAVGTSFAVQVGGDVTSVLVTSGRVKVMAGNAVARAADDSPLATVDAGQSVEVRPTLGGGSPQVTALPPAEMAERLGWRSPRVEFSSTPLADVISVVNRHNRIQFSIEDTSLASVRLSGVFQLDDPEKFARMLESNFRLTAERTGAYRITLRSRP